MTKLLKSFLTFSFITTSLLSIPPSLNACDLDAQKQQAVLENWDLETYTPGRSILDLQSWDDFETLTQEISNPLEARTFLALDIEDTIAQTSLTLTPDEFAQDSNETSPVTFKCLSSPEFFQTQLFLIKKALFTDFWSSQNGVGFHDVTKIRTNLTAFAQKRTYFPAEESLFPLLVKLKKNGVHIELFTGHKDEPHFAQNKLRLAFLTELEEYLGAPLKINYCPGKNYKLREVIRRSEELDAQQTFFLDNFLNVHLLGFLGGKTPPKNLHLVRYTGISSQMTIEALRFEIKQAISIGLLNKQETAAYKTAVNLLDGSPREIGKTPQMEIAAAKRRPLNSKGSKAVWKDLTPMIQEKILEEAFKKWKQENIS